MFHHLLRKFKLLNERILQQDIEEYINNHLKSDIHKLILKGVPFEGVTGQEVANQVICKQKSEKKLPSWFDTKNIYYPPKVSIEQTSSETAAKYKASLVSGKRLLDLTGGFGVDSFYFSSSFKTVVHCEIDTNLSKIASHNFKQLNKTNITCLDENGIEYIKKPSDLFDVIYVDPSRRSDSKGKVFLLKDCEPNIPKYIDLLFNKTKTILIKNSPILDITSASKELKYVKEIHIIAINNDVKELLYFLEKDFNGKITINTINFSKKNIKFPGRGFKILAVLPYDKKKIVKLLPNKKANITTRNFNKSVAQIRKELKIKDGGDDYLFFTKNIHDKLSCIYCKKL